MIVFDESGNSEATLAIDVLTNPVNMGYGAPNPVLPEATDIGTGGHADLGHAPCDNVKDDA